MYGLLKNCPQILVYNQKWKSKLSKNNTAMGLQLNTLSYPLNAMDDTLI